ncbi:hypothetical protein C9374_014044 [Naegleria lovaniensis]|uniref:Methanethiol oxidase n=1 Tax=Naegleria lovaniensis TaxID=51637 RepID=A0AA88KPT6_NAELO|nr:uncharacterized protein C9374_014044 [Naegleria lovaniensis]KAG2389484.1 hypothetical protein C9374_014044 [Naegleria lovaniensis]
MSSHAHINTNCSSCSKTNSETSTSSSQTAVINTKTTGYSSPLDAFHHGPREKIVYVTAISTQPQEHPDAIITVDVDPQSKTFSQIIHILPMPYKGDELHHFGWNACSSCYGCCGAGETSDSDKRRFLFVPGVKSNRFYIIDTVTNPREPKIHQIIEPEQVEKVTDLAYPHTAHCLADGNVMVSMMGTKDGKGKGGFVLIKDNGKGVFEVASQWSKEEESKLVYGYDFWYQPHHNIMVSSEWGAPEAFTTGFNPSQVSTHYGQHIYLWNWKERTLLKRVNLGEDGLIPLEVRFLHNPKSHHGYVACALSSTVFHVYKDGNTQSSEVEWKVKKVISVPNVSVSGWALPSMPSLITDFVISLDDRYLYLSNWLHGDVRQYDISNPHEPKLVGQVFIGGSLREGSGVSIVEQSCQESENGQFGVPKQLLPVPQVKGTALQGSAQMIQLSLDGKRLYVTNSLFSDWDKQFYPGLIDSGAQLIQIDVDTEKGGLTLNQNFLVDFSKTNNGVKYLAHEVRYPGGDCTSDIWL